MDPWVEMFKPAASRRTHLLLAAVMWTVVGSLLIYFGSQWVLRTSPAYAHLQIAVAAAVGAVKSRFVLDRSARRIIERIRARGDGRCLGGFVSLKTWVLIALMVSVGRWLRGGLLSRHIVGLLYAAIGVALLVSARNFWRAWYRQRMGE